MNMDFSNSQQVGVNCWDVESSHVGLISVIIN